MTAGSASEAIDAIRAVRIAAHELSNVCAAVVGGTSMAISTPTVEELGRSTRGLAPKPLSRRGKGESR